MILIICFYRYILLVEINNISFLFEKIGFVPMTYSLEVSSLTIMLQCLLENFYAPRNLILWVHHYVKELELDDYWVSPEAINKLCYHIVKLKIKWLKMNIDTITFYSQ